MYEKDWAGSVPPLEFTGHGQILIILTTQPKALPLGTFLFVWVGQKQQETRRDNVIYITSKGFMAFLDYYKIHQALS